MQELFRWSDEKTRRVAADRWLDAEEARLRVGSFEFLIRHGGPAHAPEDLVVYVPERGVLFRGDLVFRGRIPFAGQADSRQWIASLGRLIEFWPRIMVPGHGPASEPASMIVSSPCRSVRRLPAQTRLRHDANGSIAVIGAAMKRIQFVLCLAWALLATSVAAQPVPEIFRGADLALGERLIKEHGCVACHVGKVGGDGSSIYRPAGRINTPGLLRGMVEQCNTGMTLGMFPEDVSAVAAVLNRDHYRFK